ncbi:MAG: undecaprenyl-diphosphate phosphatase [bacterium]|nr:undecaprenyl-diphosphate phosphatase [bacterium]
MLEALVLGAIQGMTEWITISSDGMIVLARTVLFGHTDVRESIDVALMLHFGTMVAAIVYFRRDVGELLRELGRVITRRERGASRDLLWFLIGTTLISGALGLVLLEGFGRAIQVIGSTSGAATIRVIVGAIGVFLIATGAMLLSARKRQAAAVPRQRITLFDTVLLGVMQGFAVLPGLSRSGLTIMALLLRKFDGQQALRLSFLMSIPIVFAGNLVLLRNGAPFDATLLWGLLTSFAFGIATIHAFMAFTRRVNLGVFVIVIGMLTIIAALLSRVL